MADSIINCADPADADVVLIGARYDGTSSFGKGADAGPEAIRACLARQIEFFERTTGESPGERLRIAWVDAGELGSLDPEAMVERLSEVYRGHAGAWRLLVGGEHSVSNAPFRALADRAAGTTILQIDAHADLRHDDSDYSDRPHGRYAHCSVMRRAHELGFSLVQVGIRAYSEDERLLFDDPRITVFEWGPRPASPEEIVAAIGTEDVYVTVDADGLDPGVMPATGTPVPGGLSWYDAVELLRATAASHRIVGADLVEVAPRPGDARTEYAAAQLAYTLVALALPPA